MIYDSTVKEKDYYDSSLKNVPLFLKEVPKSHKLFAKWFFEHYPNSKGIVGRQLNFLIYRYGRPIGIIGFNSPPVNYRKFYEFFNLDPSLPASENAKKLLNNNVFRIIHSEKNLGTQILKLARNQVRRRYKEKYNDELIGLVTFVEPPRTGAIYKADNWVYLEMTQGIEVKRRGENWIHKQYSKGVKKHIFVYRFS